MKRGALLIILILLIESVSASSIFLRDELEEGEITAYKTGNGKYTLEVMSISDHGMAARFILNDDERTDFLEKDDIYEFEDGSKVAVNSVTPNEAGDGPDFVNIYFYGTGINPIPLDDSEPEEEKKESQEKKETTEEPPECQDDSDCTGKIACTEEECIGNECVITELEGCGLNGTCYAIGDVIQDSYCTNIGWQQKKTEGESCSNGYECISNLCKENICKKESSIAGKLMGVFLLAVVLGALIYLNRKLRKKIHGRKKIKFKF